MTRLFATPDLLKEFPVAQTWLVSKLTKAGIKPRRQIVGPTGRTRRFWGPEAMTAVRTWNEARTQLKNYGSGYESDTAATPAPLVNAADLEPEGERARKIIDGMKLDIIPSDATDQLIAKLDALSSAVDKLAANVERLATAQEVPDFTA